MSWFSLLRLLPNTLPCRGRENGTIFIFFILVRYNVRARSSCCFISYSSAWANMKEQTSQKSTYVMHPGQSLDRRIGACLAFEIDVAAFADFLGGKPTAEHQVCARRIYSIRKTKFWYRIHDIRRTSRRVNGGWVVCLIVCTATRIRGGAPE